MHTKWISYFANLNSFPQICGIGNDIGVNNLFVAACSFPLLATLFFFV